MKISNKKPPNWDRLNEVFKIGEGTVFTFGNVIYNPDGRKLASPLIAHEEVHSKQQESYGMKKWWDRYIIDPNFRLSQEIPAYQAEYKAIKKGIKDRNRLSDVARLLANTLSSPMYGSIITRTEAYKAIRREEPFTFTTEIAKN